MSAAEFEPAEPTNPQENTIEQLEILYILAERGPCDVSEIGARLLALDERLFTCDNSLAADLGELQDRWLIESESGEYRLTKRGRLTIWHDATRRSSIANRGAEWVRGDGGEGA